MDKACAGSDSSCTILTAGKIEVVPTICLKAGGYLA